MAKKISVKKYKKNPLEDTVYKKEGWVCKVCGGGVAPGVERCPCMPMNPFKIPPYNPPDIPWQPAPNPWKYPGGPEIID